MKLEARQCSRDFDKCRSIGRVKGSVIPIPFDDGEKSKLRIDKVVIPEGSKRESNYALLPAMIL